MKTSPLGFLPSWKGQDLRASLVSMVSGYGHDGGNKTYSMGSQAEPPEATLMRPNSSVIEEKLLRVSHGRKQATTRRGRTATYRTLGGEPFTLTLDKRAPAA